MPAVVSAAASRQASTSKGTEGGVSLLTAPLQSRHAYRLLELPQDLVSHFENNDSLKRSRADETGSRKSLCIKGRQNDEAVLCTTEHTFQLRQITQSNSLLMCGISGEEHGTKALTVHSNIAEILELVPIVPRMGRIVSLLEPSSYAGEEDEKKRGKTLRKYSPQQVASIVQASPKELQQGLDEAHVVLLDGFHRLVTSELLVEGLSALLAHLNKELLALDCVPLTSASQHLVRTCEMRNEVANAILTKWFGCLAEQGDTVNLFVTKIVSFLGLRLLQNRASETPILLKEFQEQWNASVGPGLEEHVDVGLLQGKHLLFPSPPHQPTAFQPARIQYFAASNLSLDPTTRFQQLFTVRPQWTLDDLAPYLSDVAFDGKRRDALLLKYARTSVSTVPVPETKQERRLRIQNGASHPPTSSVKLYSARLRT